MNEITKITPKKSNIQVQIEKKASEIKNKLIPDLNPELGKLVSFLVKERSPEIKSNEPSFTNLSAPKPKILIHESQIIIPSTKSQSSNSKISPVSSNYMNEFYKFVRKSEENEEDDTEKEAPIAKIIPINQPDQNKHQISQITSPQNIIIPKKSRKSTPKNIRDLKNTNTDGRYTNLAQVQILNAPQSFVPYASSQSYTGGPVGAPNFTGTPCRSSNVKYFTLNQNPVQNLVQKAEQSTKNLKLLNDLSAFDLKGAKLSFENEDICHNPEFFRPVRPRSEGCRCDSPKNITIDSNYFNDTLSVKLVDCIKYKQIVKRKFPHIRFKPAVNKVVKLNYEKNICVDSSVLPSPITTPSPVILPKKSSKNMKTQQKREKPSSKNKVRNLFVHRDNDNNNNKNSEIPKGT